MQLYRAARQCEVHAARAIDAQIKGDYVTMTKEYILTWWYHQQAVQASHDGNVPIKNQAELNSVLTMFGL